MSSSRAKGLMIWRLVTDCSELCAEDVGVLLATQCGLYKQTFSALNYFSFSVTGN